MRAVGAPSRPPPSSGAVLFYFAMLCLVSLQLPCVFPQVFGEGLTLKSRRPPRSYNELSQRGSFFEASFTSQKLLTDLKTGATLTS